MNKNKLAKGIYWVGAVDWDVRDFHGYSTYRGSTYNSFLVIDEKVTLFDTVKHSHMDQLLYNIGKIIDPKEIDYIVVNHVELDHSGSLPKMMEIVQPEKLICSPMGEKALIAHFHREDWPYHIVKSGDEISLGARTVQFLETRMLHWPDSMFSYLQEDGILFTSDAFGQHLASTERFDDELELDEIMQESAKYYANILNLFSPLIRKLLRTIKEMDLDLKIIAPDHGLIWRSHQDKILAAYEKWSNQEHSNRALIIYDSMWHSTEEMAKSISIGLEEEGVPAELINMQVHHRSDVVTKVLDARALILGSPTLNNGILPRMAGLLSYMKGLKPARKLGAAFGSYGWSGEAVAQLNTIMDEMKIERINDGLRLKYVPTEESLDQCREYGRELGRSILASEEGK
ncbi:FprA family A-type flavoprotein [Desulfotalea psychrophila]|uniref:Probable flavoprotein n=1 Tax=Desulfotalea psychrophila (strain LSv54 / DSM 12343) TaxID=177439 RepID=Q6AMP9_DESPS|nr:flavodoxin domain-containing protein [Desulfotalea psychrophila]CAG36376.1 probable flavoprotein [Desulfotalea psychrophila LSv54]